jgi:hypothetical protein
MKYLACILAAVMLCSCGAAVGFDGPYTGLHYDVKISAPKAVLPDK